MLTSVFLLLTLAQQPLPLYPGKGVFVDDLDHPDITPYLADKAKATGAAVIVCPGGGYSHLAMDHEGIQIARWLNSMGVHAFVLKYRLAPRYKHPAMLDDVSEAFKIVRKRSAEWGVDSKRVGVWGFSAGGHLAATISTHFTKETRPDFAILSYPVITCAETWMHKGSCKNLLGDSPDPKLIDLLSNEKQVTKDTPPTFLFHTTDDQTVPVENALAYYAALRKNNVEAELHIFEHGRHGVGLAPGDWVLSSWSDLLAKWLVRHGITK